MNHHVRVYDPVADVETWVGPLPHFMADLIANCLYGNGFQTRVYSQDELPRGG